MVGRVINRHQLISTATGVVRANKPNLLTDYNGDLVLTDKSDRVLQKLKWSKHKGTTEKGEPSLQLFVEEMFTFLEKHSFLNKISSHLR